MSDNRIAFRAADPLQQQLAARTDHPDAAGTPGLVARRDLERYYTVLADSLARLDLTLGQACLLMDALNGTWMDTSSYRLLWAEVDDSIREENLAGKWSVDGAQLVERLRSLSPGEQMAMVDAAERFWLLVERGATGDREELLRKVGLLRPDSKEEQAASRT